MFSTIYLNYFRIIGRKSMYSEEMVRILAWRQENVILKESSGVLMGQGQL